MAPRTLFKLPPDTPAKWSIAAANAGLINQTIKSRGSLESGSKITEEQFLLLRILTTTAAPGSLNPNRWGLTPYIAQAQAALLNPGFLQFLGAIPAGAGAARIPGAFRQAQIQYLEVIEGLTKKKQLEDIDETSINSSLITLLQGITDLVPTAGRRWRSRHVKLTINYGRRPGDKKDRKFTAVTDGQLQRSGGGRAISALVECKRAPRMEKRHKEAMQEAAEFATWVGDYRTGPGHARAMISQNGDMLYISFFEYDRRWESYIRGYNVQNAGFARVHRYGPWYISRAVDMADFAEKVLAIVLFP